MIESTIKEVTVYTDRAAISRYTTLELDAGVHELCFEDLPLALDNNSVQMSAEAESEVTLLDVMVKQAKRISSANERLKELDNQIKALQKDIKTIQDKEAVLNSQRAFIDEMQKNAFTVTSKSARLTPEEIHGVMALAKENLTNILTEQRELIEQKEKLNEQLKVLESQRHPLTKQQDLHVKNITVRLSLEQPAKIVLKINYVTFNASWYPQYDARLNTLERQVNLNYLGVISQQTGEDWKNVQLTLSTARPSLGGNVPTLYPWFVDVVKPILTPQHRASHEIYAEEASDLDMMPVAAGASPKKSARYQSVTVEAGLTSASFKVENPTSLASDGSQQKVAITQIKLPSKLQYQAIPRLQETAYLQAETTNNSDFPLLAGNVNIFMDNRFIASGHLETTMPNEKFKLDLGADEALAITFKQLKHFTEKAGLMGGGERVIYEYLITAQNNKNTNEVISLTDHIPVSQNEKITINLLSPAKKELIQTDEQAKEGVIVWDWLLSTGDKKEMLIKFAVEYPATTLVTGL